MTTYLWDFGDGSTSTEKNPAHTYTTAGEYTVRLVATNMAGSTAVTKTGVVTARPPAAPASDPIVDTLTDSF